MKLNATIHSRYRDIDNYPTPWLAEHKTNICRLLRYLYKKYCNEIDLPPEITATLVREKQKSHPKYGKVTHILFTGKGCAVDGNYLFDQFGNQIIE